VNIDFFY